MDGTDLGFCHTSQAGFFVTVAGNFVLQHYSADDFTASCTNQIDTVPNGTYTLALGKERWWTANCILKEPPI